MATKLFVGNLTYTSTENDLQDLFSQAGGVISVNIMQDRTTGRSRGFAFVEMASPADAEKAISMFHQKDFQGRPLTVNEARPREERPPGQRFNRGPGGGGGGGGDRRYGGGGGGGGGGGYRDRH
ncbi:MAG TPA: RNA-binding protein [Verrucomicrobiae bacterium]|jgi:RNA recognition motif-containing protein